MAHALRSARWATNGHFFVNGLSFASWGVNVPAFMSRHQLSEGSVSIAMLAAGIGALLGVLRAGTLIGRIGARATCAGAGLLTVTSLGLILWVPSYESGVAVLFVFGLANSIYDVAMNAHAVEVESAYQRPIMSSCHGFFSVGGLVGAFAGSLLATAGVLPATHMLMVAICGVALALSAIPFMLPDPVQTAAQARESGGGLSHLRGVVLLLGLMAAFGLIGEGAMYDWSVLHMRESLGSSQPVAALAYAAFSVTMALGRFGGDYIRARLGAADLLRWSGLLAAISLLLAVASTHAMVALMGFALVGLGVANMVPVLFSCASRVPGISAAHGIAGVASIGYLGFLAGPPFIGMLAQQTSLPLALGVLSLFFAAQTVLARRATSFDHPN
ncbi:MAG: MFS transporter [Hylemonella sp.]|nr:MFS transporter [Hylemonella sp.]MDH5709732.1 MFS transporter [Hylemonella sp.]